MGRRKREIEAAVREQRIAPGDEILKRLAAMPEDVQRLALGFGYGLLLKQSQERNARGREA